MESTACPLKLHVHVLSLSMIKNRVLSSAGYGTHLVPLIAAVMATKGDVLELGMGDFSTPMLHELLKRTDRLLVSIENDKEWFKNFSDLGNDKHFLYNSKYNIVITNLNFSVVLVDNAPAEDRINAIQHYMNDTEIFVVHDTDKMDYYGYTEAFKQFKYTKTYERYKKSTTLLSNSIDVTKII
jgi:hypothetical protein